MKHGNRENDYKCETVEGKKKTDDASETNGERDTGCKTQMESV